MPNPLDLCTEVEERQKRRDEFRKTTFPHAYGSHEFVADSINNADAAPKLAKACRELWDIVSEIATGSDPVDRTGLCNYCQAPLDISSHETKCAMVRARKIFNE